MLGQPSQQMQGRPRRDFLTAHPQQPQGGQGGQGGWFTPGQAAQPFQADHTFGDVHFPGQTPQNPQAPSGLSPDQQGEYQRQGAPAQQYAPATFPGQGQQPQQPESQPIRGGDMWQGAAPQSASPMQPQQGAQWQSQLGSLFGQQGQQQQQGQSQLGSLLGQHPQDQQPQQGQAQQAMSGAMAAWRNKAQQPQQQLQA